MKENTNTMLTAALNIAKHYPVFPCNPDNKAPYTKNGFKDATKDPAIIKRMWKQHRDALIGVPTGAASGLLVLDLDRKPNGHDGVATWNKWVEEHGEAGTLVNQTPSTGEHQVFNYREFTKGIPIKNIPLDKLAPGIEVKAEGGYVIFPPSRMTNGKEYIIAQQRDIADEPPWLRDKIDSYIFGKMLDQDAGKGIVLDEIYDKPQEKQREPIEKIEFALGAYPSDDYKHWFETGCALYDEMKEAGYPYFEKFSHKSKKFNKIECRKKWEECKKVTGYHINTVYAYADELGPGWREHYRKWQQERAESKSGTPGRQYSLVWAKDVILRAKDWAWEGHLLRGAQELTTGQPDVGKSQLHCHYTGILTTTGRKWPDGKAGPKEATNVIMVTAEDTLDQEIVPRLIAAGADLGRVAFLKKIKKDSKERMFLLSEDIEVLGQMIADINAGAVMLDPITAFMGKINSNLPTDVRNQLGPLKDLAERTNVLFSTITHPPKAGGQRAIDHFISSQAFIAAARIGHLCIEEIEIGEDGKPVRDEKGQSRTTGRNLLTVVRCAAGPKMATLAYRIEVLTVGYDPIKQEPIVAPHLVWAEHSLTVTADQAVSRSHAAREKEKEKKQTSGDVVSFLQDMLANGPVPIKIIEERAQDRFSKDQLNRAKTKLKIEPKKDGAGGWIWGLPDPELGL